jgi:cytochrome d ubiquinol oxidase subunit I
MASIGAYYLLNQRDVQYGKMFVKTGMVAAAIAIVAMFATGDMQGQMIVKHQPATLAAMEGLFETAQGAPLAILGQPDVEQRKLDNPLLIPNVLSFLTYRRWSAEVKGLDQFPREQWPDNIPLLYYSFHIMVGLGTIFTALVALSLLAYWRGKLFETRGLLWAWMLAAPLPYIANTAGWMAAELGRQPWIIYGLMRTDAGHSPFVSAGNAMFTLIGFMGMYTVLSILFLYLVGREINHGPEYVEPPPSPVLDKGLSPAHGD